MNKRTIVFALLGALLLLGGCMNNDVPDYTIKVQPSEVTLNYGQQYTLATSPLNVTIFVSDDPYYAAVDQKGTITGGKVGQTFITVKSPVDKKTVKVTVKPKINLYSSPQLSFGSDMDQVKSLLGEPTEEDSTLLYYKPDAYRYIYIFDKNTLLQVNVNIDDATNMRQTLINFLTERYVYLRNLVNDTSANKDGVYDLIYQYTNGLTDTQANMSILLLHAKGDSIFTVTYRAITR